MIELTVLADTPLAPPTFPFPSLFIPVPPPSSHSYFFRHLPVPVTVLLTLPRSSSLPPLSSLYYSPSSSFFPCLLSILFSPYSSSSSFVFHPILLPSSVSLQTQFLLSLTMSLLSIPSSLCSRSLQITTFPLSAFPLHPHPPHSPLTPSSPPLSSPISPFLSPSWRGVYKSPKAIKQNAQLDRVKYTKGTLEREGERDRV